MRVEGGGQGRTPGRSGHSDLMTKPVFSGKTNSIATRTHYCPERQVTGTALLTRQVLTVREQVGECPLACWPECGHGGTRTSLFLSTSLPCRCQVC